MTSTAEFVLSDDTTVTVREHATPNGSRLSVIPEAGPESRLAPLELESLTWQEEGFIDEHAPSTSTSTAVPQSTPPSEQPSGVDRESVEPDATIRIGNEYALVEVSAIELSEGDRLLVSSVKLGYRTVLCPSDLAVIAQQDASFFSELLATPLGPEPDDLVEFH